MRAIGRFFRYSISTLKNVHWIVYVGLPWLFVLLNTSYLPVNAAFGIEVPLNLPAVIAGIISGLLVLIVVLNYYNVLKQPYGTTSGNAEFYSNRDELELAKGKPSDEFANSTEIWASWFAPDDPIRGDQNLAAKITKLILLSPDRTDEDLDSFGKTDEHNADVLRSRIGNITSVVKVMGGSVYGYRGPQANVTIFDPLSKNGWARLEFYLPELPSGDRPSIYISKIGHDALFQKLLTMFHRIETSKYAHRM